MSKPDQNDKPSDGAILERAFSLANEAMWAVALQRRRIRSREPEDDAFASRIWVDLQFLTLSLRRLRLAAKLAESVSIDALSTALKNFDVALPPLTVMRNVGEHIDEYALDQGHEKSVSRRMLQVGEWDGTTYRWLGQNLNVDTAHDAARELYSAVRSALRSLPKRSPRI